jgi:Protein of unknown function (DUF2874).
MKKLIISLLCFIAISPAMMAGSDKPIVFTQLPQQSQQFINKYFADNSIALIKKDGAFFYTSYDIIFTNGNKVEFDRKGNWTDVECKHAQIPMGIIPEQIRNYLSRSYPNIKIDKIEKKTRGRYEIELTNDIDLIFDAKYNLISID